MKEFARRISVPISEGGLSQYKGELTSDPNGGKDFAPFWQFTTSFTNT